MADPGTKQDGDGERRVGWRGRKTVGSSALFSLGVFSTGTQKRRI